MDGLPGQARSNGRSVMRPSKGFWGLRRAIYFQGFGEKGHLFSGIWGESITFLGFREQMAEKKHFRELGRKVIFFFQGAGSKDTPPPWGPSILEALPGGTSSPSISPRSQ